MPASSTPTGHRIVLPYPHPGQQHVLRTARRFNWLCAGRRWRKTTLAMAIAVEAALRGERVIWGAPVYDQVRVSWDETKRSAGAVAAFKQDRMVALFPGGGNILWRSLDNPDNARGHTADLVIVDEAGDVAGEAWHDVLRPMLIDTNGAAWLMGTPKGQNWFWREHRAAEDRADSMSWSAPTLGCRIDADAGLVREPHPLENPSIPFRELVDLYETMPQSTFEQEILASFLQNAGGVFRKVREAVEPRHIAVHTDVHGRFACCDGSGVHIPHDLPVTIAIDWAKQADFTVLLALKAGHVVDLDRFNGVGWELQSGRAKTFIRRWNPAIVMPEYNAMGGPLVERLQAELPDVTIIPFETTAPSKKAAIENLVLGIERGLVTYPNHQHLVEELEAYQYTTSSAGNIRMSAPPGAHDDIVMALAIAWWAATNYAPAARLVPGNW